jgi:4-diphosphocytidyl-2-C-methyl-D-erythritol kinase
MRSICRSSPCKINLLLNILGRRSDGFHQLETVFQPVSCYDHLEFTRSGSSLTLACTDPRLPTDSTNLVHRAATSFLHRAGIRDGIHIHLEKQIPMEAGLGGGSGNAAHTLRGLNELFGHPLSFDTLRELASGLGSDIVFFLEDRPALATGRGEQVVWLDPFPALRGCSVLLVHPGFGVPTAWAYRALSTFPEALHGQPGRAQRLVDSLSRDPLPAIHAQFYNAFEAPVFHKFPLLALIREFFGTESVVASLLSGSGSAMFAIVGPGQDVELLRGRFHERFGTSAWSAIVSL